VSVGNGLHGGLIASTYRLTIPAGEGALCPIVSVTTSSARAMDRSRAVARTDYSR